MGRRAASATANEPTSYIALGAASATLFCAILSDVHMGGVGGPDWLAGVVELELRNPFRDPCI